MYICDTSIMRTVVHDYKEAIEMSGMKTTMELVISTFKKFGVLEEKLLREIPAETNRILTRWVLSTKTNQDGTKKAESPPF